MKFIKEVAILVFVCLVMMGSVIWLTIKGVFTGKDEFEGMEGLNSE